MGESMGNSWEFSKLIVYFGICGLMLIGSCHSRPAASVPGSVSRTRVTNFRFFARIANPCEIEPVNNNSPNHQEGIIISYAEPETLDDSNSTATIEYFQLVVVGLELVQNKLADLEGADQNLQECNGLSLNSLPATGPLDSLNLAEAIKQSYKSMSFLATHFHLMSYDRQLTETGAEDQPENELEDEDTLPPWRFRLCGNESSTLKSNLEEATTQLESVICTIQTGATEEQRASFREPMNQLQNTVLYRYHTSCSTLRTRDCLVMREAKQAVQFLLRKFRALINNDSDGNHEDDNDLMSNSL